MTYHYQIREYLREMRENPAILSVLTVLLSHANIRMRSWPSIDKICEETGWSIESVTNAKQWLLERGAIALVPYAKRVDEETRLSARLHVYQMTGAILTQSGDVKPYLYLTPEAEKSIEAALDNILPDRGLILYGVEVLPGRGEVIPEDSKDIPSSSPSLKKKTKAEIVSGKGSSYDSDIRYETLNEKPGEPTWSSLALRLRQEIHGSISGKQSCLKRLDQPINTVAGVKGSANELWDTEEAFRAWVEDRLVFYMDYLREKNPKPASLLVAMINVILSMKVLNHPQYGLVAFCARQNAANSTSDILEREQAAKIEAATQIQGVAKRRLTAEEEAEIEAEMRREQEEFDRRLAAGEVDFKL